MFVLIINSFESNTTNTNQTQEENSPVVSVEEKTGKTEEKKQPDIPVEFTAECPVSFSASMYDNIIGVPELCCNFKNKTDKEISALQLYFVPKDVYGEELTGIFIQNKLQYDTPIPANGKATVTWQLLDQTIKSGDVYVYSVYFSDGTEWGNRNAPTSKIKKYALKLYATY